MFTANNPPKYSQTPPNVSPKHPKKLAKQFQNSPFFIFNVFSYRFSLHLPLKRGKRLLEGSSQNDSLKGFYTFEGCWTFLFLSYSCSLCLPAKNLPKHFQIPPKDATWKTKRNIKKQGKIMKNQEKQNKNKETTETIHVIRKTSTINRTSHPKNWILDGLGEVSGRFWRSFWKVSW